MDFAPHFPESEMTHSDTAIAHGLENSCPAELRDTLAATSWKAEQARKILGVPCKVNSGFRSLALNNIVAKGSNTTGVHPLALAVDIMPIGLDLAGAFAALQSDPEFMLDVDQLIIEAGCLHIGRPRSGQQPRHELHTDQWINGVRHYPLVGIWKPGTVIRG
jgi:hypothetical protein